MRALPFAMTQGAILGALVREARRDPRRNCVCGCCSSLIPIEPDRAEQIVRCPDCHQTQHVGGAQEAPWRLTPNLAEALRRTKSWPRWLG